MMFPSALLRSYLVYAFMFTWIPSARMECSSSSVLQAACVGLSIQNYLENVGSDESVTITCPNNGHPFTGWSQSPNGDGENLPSLDTSLSKYTVNENMLTISNVDGTDEGLYRCVYGESQTRHTCIYVYGRAVFASCPLDGLDSCTTIPTSLSVREGGSVSFDATVVHTPGGSCGFQQPITDVQLIKINPKFGVSEEQLLFCRTNGDSVHCGNGRVSLSRGNDPGYEFVFTLSGASSSDSGMYKVVVGLTHPRTGSVNSITKMFHLNVTAPPTTAVTTDASTTTTDHSSPSLETDSSTDTSISVSSKPNNLTIPIAVAAAVSVIIVVLVLASIIGIGIIVRIKRNRKKRISQETTVEKGPCIQTVVYSGQPIYAAIKDVTVLQNHMNGATRGVRNPPFMPAEQATEVELPPPNNRASLIEPDSAVFNHWDNIDNQVVSNV